MSEKTYKNVWHSMADHLVARAWDVITTSHKVNRWLRFMDMIWTIIRYRKKYALAQVDVFSGKSFIWAQVCVLFLRFFHKPVILTLHGGGLPEFASKHPKRVRKTLNQADVVVSPSPYHQIALKNLREDIKVIPNPVNLSAAIYKKRINPKPQLIWVRAFHEIYNPCMAIEVVDGIIGDFPAVKLIMVGPDKGDGSLQTAVKLAQDRNILDHIEIIGAVPHYDVPKYLDRADIFINTSQYDTAPRSVLEAMANGLCVVSTDVGGIPWMIDNEKDGMLVPPNDVYKMTSSVRRILNNHAFAGKLSEHARLKAESFTWDNTLEQWEAVFFKVLETSHE